MTPPTDSAAAPPAPPVPVPAAVRASILEDTGAHAERPGAVIETGSAGPEAAPTSAIDAALAHDGLLLFVLAGKPTDRELAQWRDRLWPLLHVVALYELGAEGARRRTLGGAERVTDAACEPAVVLAARRRAHVMSPDATTEKFDQNAAGWNGEPGSPGYPHFRWMRQYVAHFGRVAPGVRVLDFGCGAGWVGIEAARKFRATELAFFDPSPEMVRIAEQNCRDAKLESFEGRTGFGEDPPFADVPPFGLVLASGVLSFSPDPERWFDGLLARLAPGGQLVIGDIHRDSAGMRRRRREKPLLPARELNAWTRDEALAELRARGLVLEEKAGYQLTRPVPEAMHVNETKLGGALTIPLLLANRAAAAVDRRLKSPFQDRFDSWVMRLRRPR